MKLVIKIGTSTLTHKTGRINLQRIERLCRVISDLKNAGHSIVLVSSGAIGCGVGRLGLSEKPADMPGKQAAAAVGQCELMYIYDKLFGEYSHTVAQLLLTGEDVENPTRRRNIENTLSRLLSFGVLPIINENDSVVTTEIAVGDNDTLGAIAAKCVGADLLIVLTDTEGLYTADPSSDGSARLIPEVRNITPEIKALAGGSASGLGTGGMATKLHAAEIVTSAGIDMVIASGRRPENLYDIVSGSPVGTRFFGVKE